MIRFRKYLPTRRYLSKLIIWFTTSVTVIVAILTACVYLTAHKIFMESEYETNKEILSQVEYNVNFMNQSISNISNYIFVNPAISSILNSLNANDYDTNTLYTTLNNVIEPTLLSNNYIDSICIYNGKTDKYYYTGKYLFFGDEELKTIINKSQNIPKEKPIFRKIKNEYGKATSYEEVITYIIYETGGTPKKVDSAVIINVSPQWLLNNIKAIDMVKNDDRIFVLDSNGNFVLNQSGDEPLKQVLTNQYKKNTNANNNAIGSWEFNFNNEKYIATYCQIEDAGLSLLKVQPEKEVNKYVDSLNTSIIFLSIVIFLLSVFVANAVSRNLYKPLGKLIKQAEANQNHRIADTFQDEISYLNNIYKYSAEQLKYYNQEMTKNRSIIKSYWLKKFLTEKKIVEKSEFEKICSENMINLPYEGNFTICVLKIDNFDWFRSINDGKDKKILNFAIINIMCELISEIFQADGFETSDDNIVIFVGLKNNNVEYIKELQIQIKKAQEHIIHYFSVSVTVSIGIKVESISKITESYENALNNSMYRYILGKASIITPDKVKQNNCNTNCEHSKKLEARLTESIKIGNMDTITKCLLALVNEISCFSFDNIMFAEIHLVESVKKAVGDNTMYGILSKQVDFKEIEHMVFEMETQDEFSDLLLSAIHSSISGQYESESELRNKIISETAIDIISKSYGDTTLCQNQIADLMKISPRCLSRAFKNSSGMSITDYLGDIRLKKAAELLEKTQMNVYDIIVTVGFENESYFYKVFKYKFGCTPKQYALIKNLNYDADTPSSESPDTL